MTYRTEASSELGRWKLAIVRDGGPTDSWATASVIKPPELVAVVVNGDQELAERICALLNADRALADSDGFCSGHGHTPDVDHARGAAEALAFVRRQLGGDDISAVGDTLLRAAAAELGLDEDAQPGRLLPEDTPGDRAARAELAARIGGPGWSSGEDASSAPLSAPVAAVLPSVVPASSPDVPEPAQGDCTCSGRCSLYEPGWGES
jgi:hypothetical protein